MKIAVCLHGAAVVRAALALHPTDRDLLALGLALGAETVVLELVGTPGLAPRAINEAVALGAAHPLRVVDEALGTTDAHATGLVMERILHELDPELVLFSPSADPEGLTDVPAAIAFRRAVPCVSEVVAVMIEPASSSEGRPRFVVRAQRGDRLAQLEVPRGALVGVHGLESQPGRENRQAAPPSPADTAIRVVTLSDLGVDRVQVLRRNDLRGVIEPAARPLVTTRSVASLVSLLR
jgi:electron transfer flavoprotein alpha/beta subunit